MKIISLLFLIGLSNTLLCQDILILKNGDRQEVRAINWDGRKVQVLSGTDIIDTKKKYIKRIKIKPRKLENQRISIGFQSTFDVGGLRNELLDLLDDHGFNETSFGLFSGRFSTPVVTQNKLVYQFDIEHLTHNWFSWGVNAGTSVNIRSLGASDRFEDLRIDTRSRGFTVFGKLIHPYTGASFSIGPSINFINFQEEDLDWKSNHTKIGLLLESRIPFYRSEWGKIGLNLQYRYLEDVQIGRFEGRDYYDPDMAIIEMIPKSTLSASHLSWGIFYQYTI